MNFVLNAMSACAFRHAQLRDCTLRRVLCLYCAINFPFLELEEHQVQRMSDDQ
jgi:hypothetical protein